jgi:lipopolysaccharide/colanic/teichoic acid biosynthesis glycosyltransferase
MYDGIYCKYIKRILDLIFGIIGFLFFCISFIFVAPAIYFTDKGSIFYKSKRRGKREKVFYMYKYRSMRVNAPDLRNEDNTTYNGENDPRVTKIGKILRATSIDELPQFINVLKGDMSIIGPRPNVPTDGLSYDDIPEERKKRLQVKSGIAGYAQAYYRNSATLNEKIEADNYYVDNVSFKLDVKIFILTIIKIITRKDVYIKQSENKTLRSPKSAEEISNQK